VSSIAARNAQRRKTRRTCVSLLWQASHLQKGDRVPAYVKLLVLARHGWKRLPPEQRRKVLKGAAKTARKHGPTLVKHAATAVKAARKTR
jgi:acyl-CoA reductase-like NAD-dependent aldehyde dehydrogenase